MTFIPDDMNQRLLKSKENETTELKRRSACHRQEERFFSQRNIKKEDLPSADPQISKRIMGIEPTSQPWEGRILPMNYIRAITETQYRRFIQEKQD